MYWNNDTKGNTVKMYFLIAPNVDEVEPAGVKESTMDAMRNVSNLISHRLFAIRPDWTLYSNK